ncbi:MAG: ATP-binding cassette domain-containing protein, partial [Polyangia bacterium]
SGAMIEIEHVSKHFGRLCAVDDVSLHIGRGERVGFVGANGSGKTTLLRALVGLYRVAGRILVDGIDVARSPETALTRVAYLPQIAPPLDAPVAELVRAYAALRGFPVARVAARAEALGVPLGNIARARLRDLSGGTKQKLLGALALAAETPVLVCDEPTANLDAAARAAFFAAVDARPADAVLVLCSHRADEIESLVDRVIELRDGRLFGDQPTRRKEAA